MSLSAHLFLAPDISFRHIIQRKTGARNRSRFMAADFWHVTAHMQSGNSEIPGKQITNAYQNGYKHIVMFILASFVYQFKFVYPTATCHLSDVRIQLTERSLNGCSSKPSGSRHLLSNDCVDGTVFNVQHMILLTQHSVTSICRKCITVHQKLPTNTIQYNTIRICIVPFSPQQKHFHAICHAAYATSK